MRYRKLDADGDYTIGVGRGGFWVDDKEGIAQSVKTRLQLWAGEWFLDYNEGTPYNPLGLGIGALETVEPMVRARVLDTDGVTSIDRYDQNWDGDTRTVTVTMTISTIYGQATLTTGLR